MGECSVPGCEGDGNISFTCNECGGTFCSKHRLPESHGCPALLTDSYTGKRFESGHSGNEETEINRSKSESIEQKQRSEREYKSKQQNEKDKSKTEKEYDTIDPQTLGTTPNLKGDKSPQVTLKSGQSKDNQIGNKNSNHSNNSKFIGGYRVRWATWFYRIVAIILAALLISILLVGFTPITIPDGVPPQISEPIDGAASASSTLVANLTNTSLDDGPIQDTTDKSANDTSDSGTIQPTSKTRKTASENLDIGRIENRVHQGVNEERRSRGLNSLSMDSDLQTIARYHSKDMSQSDYFAHTAPDGETMEDRYDKFGYQCRVSVGNNRYVTGGENIYFTSFSGIDYTEQQIANETVTGWMNSAGHRENILRDYWNNEGIGVYIEQENGTTKVYVTQNFC